MLCIRLGGVIKMSFDRAGFDQDHLNSKGDQFPLQGIAQSFQGELGRGVGAIDRRS
jgi:hypothetical protein